MGLHWSSLNISLQIAKLFSQGVMLLKQKLFWKCADLSQLQVDIRNKINMYLVFLILSFSYWWSINRNWNYSFRTKEYSRNYLLHIFVSCKVYHFYNTNNHVFFFLLLIRRKAWLIIDTQKIDWANESINKQYTIHEPYHWITEGPSQHSWLVAELDLETC